MCSLILACIWVELTIYQTDLRLIFLADHNFIVSQKFQVLLSLNFEAILEQAKTGHQAPNNQNVIMTFKWYFCQVYPPYFRTPVMRKMQLKHVTNGQPLSVKIPCFLHGLRLLKHESDREKAETQQKHPFTSLWLVILLHTL